MKLIKPKHEILFISPKPLETIEAAGRTCYKSEDKITEGSAKIFTEMISKRGHLSVVEHPHMSVRFICDRGVSHEIVRHRLASYSQECVSGNTKIRKGLTIKDLYNRKQGSCYDRTHNKTIRLKSADFDGNIISNSFINIFCKGFAKVFEVKTKLGYTICCTKDHRFLTPDGTYKELNLLSSGDSVCVNGRPCLLKINDNILTDLYLYKEVSPLEISEGFNVPYRTVLRRLQQLGIFSKHLNDHDKEKYNINHTQASYAKMKATIQQQYDDGRVVWNKGIKEGEHLSVDRQAESLRKHHHNNQPGALNSNWTGGPTKHIEAQLLKDETKQCELCGIADSRLEVHHIDEDITNNEVVNLLKVCCHCHHILHHGWYVGKRSMSDTIISITNKGTEVVFDLQMSDPYNNYVADGFITHNSTRYCNYKGGVTFIIPPWINIRQGDYSSLPSQFTPYTGVFPANDAKDEWYCAMRDAEARYLELLKKNWSPQQARSVLPNSLKTEIVMTANLREWMHVFKLRTSKAAHPQMRELMIPLLEEMKTLVPVIFDDIKGE